MAESLSLQAGDLSLPELFQKGWETQKEVESGELPSNSKEFQVSDFWAHYDIMTLVKLQNFRNITVQVSVFSLASHTLRRERKGLVMLQPSSSPHKILL